jgi:hypothetical protein
MATRIEDVEDDLLDPPEEKNQVVVEFPEPRVTESPSVFSLVHPVHSGFIEKQGVTFGCIPTWKRRYLVLKAGYLFKFESERGAKPKGVPIPLPEAEWAATPLDKKPFCFTISTIRKQYLFSATNYHDMTQWLSVLSQQKLIAIKQAMGHLPLSEDDRYANAAGEFLCKKKLEAPVDQVVEAENGVVVPAGAPAPLFIE